MQKFNKLYTSRGEAVNESSWHVYPRPQLVRDSFYNLNGKWDFEVTNGEQPQSFSKEILVPYPPESMLSGVDTVFLESETLWYKKEFSITEKLENNRVILHFGAVDQKCKVFVNQSLVGEHVGGYDAFSFDITDFVNENNELVVSVTDTLSDYVLPYGKQCQKRGGMWYTPVSGIWQTVWLEIVPETFVKSIKINAKENKVNIAFEGIKDGLFTLKTDSGDICYNIDNGAVDFVVESPCYWSPENPYLYYFYVNSGNDKIKSYFALRTLEIKEVNGISRMCLNGKPYFFHGLLDQGYWSDGIFTPASYQCFEDDILAMKSLGFNMLRKHIKVEIERFYYDCDRLGMIVFQDMVNNSDYSFFRDTALPTVGLLKRNDENAHNNKLSRKAFVDGMNKTVNQLYNHPCICCWTIFNEGWGQFCSSTMYDELRKLDSSRFIDSASGWFLADKTDLDSKHIYFKKLKYKKSDKPFYLSEFGGYSYKPHGHVFNTQNTYGYGKLNSREEFVKAFCDLYNNQVMPLVEKGLCATVYTQVSDVEDETNGLLSYDRKVLKVLPEEFLDISQKLKSLI